MYVCIYLSIYIYIYLSIHIYIYTHTYQNNLIYCTVLSIISSTLFYATLYFYSSTIQREMLHLLQHYIYLTAVTFQIKILQENTLG